MNDILFEDLYVYANKYHKDLASRNAKPEIKTLADVAKRAEDQQSKAQGNYTPFPGDAITESLGIAYTKMADAHYLIGQLFNNASVNYSDSTKEKVNLKLKKIMATIQSISKDLDKHDKPGD